VKQQVKSSAEPAGQATDKVRAYALTEGKGDQRAASIMSQVDQEACAVAIDERLGRTMATMPPLRDRGVRFADTRAA
jgi:hypothetical protein